MNKTLINGDMLIELDKLEENSIDAIVTDPPYELNFMNKGWDNSGISYQKETWEKCLRVLKPGGYLLAFAAPRTQHRIACAIEDAGFEIRDTIMWLYGCYSADTQVLTDSGWKYFYELDKTEQILQWDKDTNKLSWIHPLNYFEYDIDDELCLFENRHISQLVTKDHKVVAKIKKRRKEYGEYDFIRAQDFEKSWLVKYPLAGNLDGSVHEDDAYIIGWWLTDAWRHKDGKACMFSQSKPETLTKLRNWFYSNNITYSEYIKKSKNQNHRDEHIFYVAGVLANKLLSNYYDRKLTWEVLKWDTESRKLLLEGLMDGDGSYRSDEYSRTFWSMNKDRLDIFQALCISLNYRAYISNGKKSCVVFNVAHNSTETQTKHRKPNVPYKGKVYCLQTNTGAFVVRRNGRAFISGNSGFPKSMDISKQIDKRGANNTRTICDIIHSRRVELGLTLKDIDEYIGTNGMAVHWENGRRGITPENFNKLIKLLKIDADEAFSACRDIVGQVEKTESYRYKNNNVYQTNGNEDKVLLDITVPKTDLAKQWTGWGTALKPSFEPIIVARKPFKGSLVDNVIEYGVGGINIDECRVPFENTQNPATNPLYRMQNGYKSKCGSDTEPSAYTLKKEPMEMNVNAQGRFPSNLILTYDDTDFDEVCGEFPENKSSGVKPYERLNRDMVCYGRMCNKSTSYLPGDSGSACRYFYCAKASKRDRNEGLNTGKNIHTTVKPVSLMQYLVRLVSPKGSVILDPFMGSGSTGKAVAYENKDRDSNYSFVGIELCKEYFDIAEQRIAFAENDNTPLEKEEKKDTDEEETENDSVKKQRLF